MDRSVFEELLDESRLADDEVARRFEEAIEPGYWDSLRKPTGDARVTTVEVDAIGLELAQQGWFMRERVLDPLPLRQAVNAVRAAGWPPVFAFVYEELWTFLRAPLFRALGRAFLGAEPAQAAYFWAHVVPAAAEGRGWAPHADGDDPAAPPRLNLWIPLTDATLDNGCIYVVPRDRIPPDWVRTFNSRAAFDRDAVLTLLQSSRAVPAPAGSLLGWDFRTIHWGSVRHASAGEPRMSIAVELIAADSDEETIALGEPPDFRRRIALIAGAMRVYGRWEPRLVRFAALRDRLADWAGVS